MIPQIRDFRETITNAIENDPRTVYRLAKDARLSHQTIYQFMAGGEVTLKTCYRLCEALGLELRPIDPTWRSTKEGETQ